MAVINKKNNYSSREFNGLYSLSILDSNRKSKVIFNFQLLESINYKAPQGIIDYETPGGDGGLTINTGRKTEKLTLMGKLFNEYRINFKNLGDNSVVMTKNFNTIKYDLLKLKNEGVIVELTGHPYLYFENRKWVIKDLQADLTTNGDYLSFLVDLTENRQSNVKTTEINLVNTSNKIEFLNRLKIALS